MKPNSIAKDRFVINSDAVKDGDNYTSSYGRKANSFFEFALLTFS